MDVSSIFIARNPLQNSTVANTSFVLPCGCDSTFYDYNIQPPRRDDGGPIGQVVEQRDGHMYVSWTDNSRCASQFSLHRIVVTDSFLAAFNSKLGPNDDDVRKSDVVKEIVDLKNGVENAVVTSVISDFVLESSACGTRYAPRTFYDDVAGANLPVGTKLFYCMLSSNSKLGYMSSYSCLRDLIVRWEATFRVRIVAGRTTLPSGGVFVNWEARIPSSESDDEGIAFASGSGSTDRDGTMQVRVVGDSLTFPMLESLRQVPVALWFDKESQVSANETIQHTFMCDQGMRRCSQNYPQMVELSLFSFDQTVVTVEDATVVPFRGNVVLDDPGSTSPDRCPIAAVRVCLRAPPADDKSISYGCTVTDVHGKYELAAPIGSIVTPVADYQNHTFERTGIFAEQNEFRVRTQAIDNVDFVDVTKETMFVDVVGGLCNVSIASALTVTLTKNADLSCSGWHRHISLTQTSPARFSATVPASYFEIAIPSTSANLDDAPVHGGVVALAGGIGESEKISDYLAEIAPQPLNLTNVRGRGSFHTVNGTSQNLTLDEYTSLRLIRFQYDVPTAMDMVLTQDDVVVGTPTSCSDATQVVEADYNQTVIFSINLTETFATGEKCWHLTGSVKVKAATSLQSASAFKDYELVPVKDPSTNLTTHSTATFSVYVQPNPVKSVDKPYTRSVEVDYQISPGRDIDHFRVILIVVGHYMDSDAKFDTVPIVFDPIAIVRDPPGDSSYATYKNVESVITYTSNQYDLFMEMASDSSFLIGADSETEFCVMLGAGACTKMAAVRNRYGISATSKDLATRKITRTKNSFTRHIIWSFQTPGPVTGADRKELAPPGPMSDMFLVPIEIVHFLTTYNISQADACSATKTGPFVTFTLPQNNSGGLGWYSRHDIIHRIIPDLRTLLLQSETVDEFITLLGAFSKWSSMIEESPDTLTPTDLFLLEVLDGILRESDPADVFGKVWNVARPWSDFDVTFPEDIERRRRLSKLSSEDSLAVRSLARRLITLVCEGRPPVTINDLEFERGYAEAMQGHITVLAHYRQGLTNVQPVLALEHQHRLDDFIDSVLNAPLINIGRIEDTGDGFFSVGEAIEVASKVLKDAVAQMRTILGPIDHGSFRSDLFELFPRTFGSIYGVNGVLRTQFNPTILEVYFDAAASLISMRSRYGLAISARARLEGAFDGDLWDFDALFDVHYGQMRASDDVHDASQQFKADLLTDIAHAMEHLANMLRSMQHDAAVEYWSSTLPKLINLRYALHTTDTNLWQDALEKFEDVVFIPAPGARRLQDEKSSALVPEASNPPKSEQSGKRLRERRILASGTACPRIIRLLGKCKAQLEAKKAASAAKSAKAVPVQPLTLLKKAGNALLGALPFVGIALDIGFGIAAAVDVDHQSKESEKEPMPEWDPYKSMFLKDPFRPLPSKPSLWSSQSEWTKEQRKAATSNVISFSGGGARMEVEISDEFTGEKGMTLNKELTGSLALIMDSSLTIGAFNIEDNGKVGFEYSGVSSFINASVTTRITSASFVLSDSNAGDYFDVQVTRDLRYGTFAFNVTSGASKCPVEVNTRKREDPFIDTRPGDSSAYYTHPDLPAYVHLVVGHNVTDEPYTGTYELVADLKDLGDSFRILVNGMPLDHPILFEDLDSMTSYPILLEVYRGVELYDVAFELRLRNLCQKDLGTPYPIQVHFAKPCPGIELAGQLSTGEIKYILAEAEAVLQLNARRPVRSPLATPPWVNLTHVAWARFVFKTHRSTSWIDVLVEDIRNLSGAVSWDVSALPTEITLYVRAEVKCTVDGFNQQANPELFQSVSAVATIVVDRIRPILYLNWTGDSR